ALCITLFPYPTLFRSTHVSFPHRREQRPARDGGARPGNLLRARAVNSLHDGPRAGRFGRFTVKGTRNAWRNDVSHTPHSTDRPRSEEHTSELQSRFDL